MRIVLFLVAALMIVSLSWEILSKAFGTRRMPAYVVNLKRRTDRLRRLRRNNPSGYDVVEAVDAADRELPTRQWGGADADRRLTPGMVACFMSHRSVWKRIVEAGHPFALVLEDDADVVIDDARKTIAEYVDALLPGWNLLFLGTNDAHAKTSDLKEFSGDVHVATGVFYGTHCYVISRDCAADLLDKTSEGFDQPVDVYMHMNVATGRYVVHPAFVNAFDLSDSDTS